LPSSAYESSPFRSAKKEEEKRPAGVGAVARTLTSTEEKGKKEKEEKSDTFFDALVHPRWKKKEERGVGKGRRQKEIALNVPSTASSIGVALLAPMVAIGGREGASGFTRRTIGLRGKEERGGKEGGGKKERRFVLGASRRSSCLSHQHGLGRDAQDPRKKKEEKKGKTSAGAHINRLAYRPIGR